MSALTCNGEAAAIEITLRCLDRIVMHVIVFNLSAFRSFFYAIFWGIPVTLIVVAASRNEAAKRIRAREGDPPDEV